MLKQEKETFADAPGNLTTRPGTGFATDNQNFIMQISTGLAISKIVLKLNTKDSDPSLGLHVQEIYLSKEAAQQEDGSRWMALSTSMRQGPLWISQDWTSWYSS